MAGEKIKLTKKIISNKLSNKLYAKSFSDLTRSEPPVTEDRITTIYNDLFYQIPKHGKKSHESIIIESRDYLYPQVNETLDGQIDSLVDEIEKKNEELIQLQTARPSHPTYPNGSFLAAGNHNGQFQGMDTIYVMQDGMKRAIASDGMYRLIRKCLKISGEAYSELYFLSVDELNEIPDGVTIEYQWHLSMLSFAADYGDIYLRFPWQELTLYCEGREADDSYNLISGDFWLDDDPDDACTVSYVKNIYEGDPEPYSIETITIGVGQSKFIEFAEDDDGLEGIPKQVKAEYDQYYDYHTDVQRTGTRLWGKDQKYKGIVYAEGRLFIGENNNGEKFNTKTNEDITGLRDLYFDDMYGDVRRIYSHGCRQLDGTFEDSFGDLNQDDILAAKFKFPIFKYYKKTHKITSAQVQNSHLGNTTTSYNYSGGWNSSHDTFSHESAIENKTFPIYGQPILKLYGQYVVYLKSAGNEEDEDLRFHYFYNLNTTGNNNALFILNDDDIADTLFDRTSATYIDQRKARHQWHVVHNIVAGGMNTLNNPNPFMWGLIGFGIGNTRFNWEAVLQDKIEYIGLRNDPITGNKYNLTGYSPNAGNYFNPMEGGSNWGVSGEVRTILEINSDDVDYNNTVPDGFCPFTLAQLEQFSLLSVPAGTTTDLPLGCTFQNCLDC